MKSLIWFVLMFVCFVSMPCFAQPVLQGELSHGPIHGYIFDLTLTLHNVGDEPFNYTFGSSEMWYYSIDGMMVHGVFLPIILPYTLPAGQSDTFTLTNVQVLNSGEHSFQAYLAITADPAPPSPIGEPINVVIAPELNLSIGDGSQLSRVPIDFFWRSSLYECVYTAEELQHQPGYVTAISFFPDFHTLAMPAQQIYIYLGNTSQTDLGEDWISSVDMLPVVSGLVDFPIDQDEIRIPLDSGFYYNGSGNLVMMVFRPIPSSYGYHGDPFHAYAVDPVRSRKVYTDSQTFHPSNPPDPTAAQLTGFMPQTVIHLIPPDPSAVDDAQATPRVPEIKAFPNPFRDTCHLSVDSQSKISSGVDIYNLRGQRVRHLNAPGSHDLTWDGRDEGGNLCGSGVYFLRLQGKAGHIQGKVLLIR